MSIAKSFASIISAIFFLGSSAFAQDAPTTKSTFDSLKLPTNEPTTAPTTMPAANTFEGYLAPIDPFEVKLKLKQFSGPLKVRQVVPHATRVKGGDVLIEFDTTDIDEAIVAATSELEVARATNAKQQIDNTLGEQNDAQEMKIAADGVSDAELALDWWNKNDSPKFLKQLELQLKNSEFGVSDQEDELDQLKKMYKSEELTNATADIVVKRAVRQLEQSKVMLDITRGDVDRRRATEFVDRQQQVDRGLFSAKQALEALKAQQELSKVERAAAALKSKTALKNAEKKLNELEEDKSAMTVKSKIDGLAFFGAFSNGAWSKSEADAIKVDEKMEVAATFMTVIAPGKLKGIVKAVESRILSFATGETGEVHVPAFENAAMGGAEMHVKVIALSPLPGPENMYQMTLDLGNVDERMMPGMKVSFLLETK